MNKNGKRKEVKPISLTDFMLRVIGDLNAEERFSTAHVYFYALQAFKQFVGGGEIFFGAINRYSLKRFEKYLADKQKKWNTISTYERALRSVYHRAVDAEVITGEYRLFSGVYTGTKVERKRALQDEEMRLLLMDEELCKPRRDTQDKDQTKAKAQTEAVTQTKVNAQTKAKATAEVLPQGVSEKALPRELCQARDLLSLMFRLQGMPLVDLLHLHRNDLHSDTTGRTMITCHRQKTGIELRITVTAETMTLLNRYRSADPDSPYLLCFFDGINGAKAIYQEYCRQLRLLNNRLVHLAAFRGLKDTRVSSYTARHTWATTAKFCMVPESVISEGLGHSSLEVTRTYMKSFECEELDRANSIVMARVLYGDSNYWK